MKHQMVLIMALCLMLAAPVMGTALTYQNGVSYTNMSFGTANMTYINNITGGNSYIYKPYGVSAEALVLTNAYPTTYAAATSHDSAYNWGGPTVKLYSASKVLVGSYGCSLNPIHQDPCNDENARYEVKIVGTTAYFYVSGILWGTATGLTTNPSYVGFTHAGNGGGWDDIVYGESEKKHIIGMPAQNGYFIKKDMVNPAASGLYNYSTGALVDSNNMVTTWGRSNLTEGDNANESMYLINVDSGTIYETHYTGNFTANTTTWNIANSLITSGAPYGRYQIKFADFYSDEIAYIANGASISFNADDYNQQDTATITYLIDGAYWDTSTYTYSMKIYSGNDWTVISNQPITAPSGTFIYQFTSNDQQGEYYAVIIAVPNVGGDDIWMNYDYAALNAYASFHGYVNDAETTLPISGANVSFSQNSIISNLITPPDGNYTATGFMSGAILTINVTASGHFQYYVAFTPLVSGSKEVNITLNSTSPSFTGLGIGGVTRDGSFDGTTITKGYGRPIGGSTCYLRNQTGGESCTNITNMAAWYKFDEGNGCILTTKKPYDVWCSKLGYSNSPNYTVVAA